MEWFELLAGCCSIASLLISAFVASKVIKIEKAFNVSGSRNVVGGRDVNVGQ